MTHFTCRLQTLGLQRQQQQVQQQAHQALSPQWQAALIAHEASQIKASSSTTYMPLSAPMRKLSFEDDEEDSGEDTEVEEIVAN